MVTSNRGILLVAVIVLCPAAVFIVDALTPQGVEVWVLYLPVILAAVWVENARRVVGVGLACSGLVIAGAFLSPYESNLVWLDVLNRGMGLLALWLMVFAGRTITRRSAQLAEVVQRLQREVDQHEKARHALIQSEARLRLAVQGAGMGTWDGNLRTGQAVWSDRHFHMLGYAPMAGGEATMRMWQSLIHPDDWGRVQEAKAQARREHAIYAAEYRISRADNGEVVWLAVFGRFLYDEAGEAVRFVGVSFDVTRRKRLECEVLDIVVREQRRIGQELHDGVGQELTGVGLMANALAERLPDGTSEKRVAVRLVAELDRLHQQVRALSHGLVPVEVEPHGLRAALEDLAARATEQSGVPVNFVCPAEVAVPDHATATELFRIAQEAVNNALRHARSRHVWVRLSLEADALCLSVRDDGEGLPPRLDPNTGSGLRIMRYRAEQLGGALHIGPAEGGGTVVGCRLPGRNAHGEEKPGPIAAPGEGSYR